MKSIKIDGETYEYHDVQCQLTFGTHANLYLTFDISKNPSYKKPIITLYESDKRFDIITTKFISKSNNIKLMDISERFINLEIRSEILETIPQDIRRDNLLDDILTPTFRENDSINKE
jgi:hypothetical protein